MRRRVDRWDFWKALVLLDQGWAQRDSAMYDRMRDFVVTLGVPA